MYMTESIWMLINVLMFSLQALSFRKKLDHSLQLERQPLQLGGECQNLQRLGHPNIHICTFVVHDIYIYMSAAPPCVSLHITSYAQYISYISLFDGNYRCWKKRLCHAVIYIDAWRVKNNLCVYLPIVWS